MKFKTAYDEYLKFQLDDGGTEFNGELVPKSLSKSTLDILGRFSLETNELGFTVEDYSGDKKIKYDAMYVDFTKLKTRTESLAVKVIRLKGDGSYLLFTPMAPDMQGNTASDCTIGMDVSTQSYINQRWVYKGHFSSSYSLQHALEWVYRGVDRTVAADVLVEQNPALLYARFTIPFVDLMYRGMVNKEKPTATEVVLNGLFTIGTLTKMEKVVEGKSSLDKMYNAAANINNFGEKFSKLATVGVVGTLGTSKIYKIYTGEKKNLEVDDILLIVVVAHQIRMFRAVEAKTSESALTCEEPACTPKNPGFESVPKKPLSETMSPSFTDSQRLSYAEEVFGKRIC